jgi:hypothetical protein
MHRILFLTFLTFTPLYAFGDFVPGRTRASAQADLHRLQGDGRYQNVTGAHAQQFVTDGRGITKFSLSLDRRPEIAFAVRSVQQNRCGRVYLASISEDGRDTSLQITETAPTCSRDGNTSWHAALTTAEDNGPPSRLGLEGVPEFYQLTQ